MLKAAGHRVRRRAGLPSGLTAREAEVPVRLGQGRPDPEIAAGLHVSRKTISSAGGVHLCQARGEDPHRGSPVRHAPRPDRDGGRAGNLTER